MKARYQLPSVNPLTVVQAAYNAASSLQTFTPGEQVAAAAVLLKVMSERTGVSISELLNKAERMEKDADTNYTREIRALREYVKEELR